MNDAKPPQPGRPLLLGASVFLFGLFGVQIAYQIFHANHLRLDVNADLSAELADAVFVEEEPAPASAGWPQWRGPHRDGVVHLDTLATTWPKEGPPLLWKKDIPLGYSSFAVKDSRFYSLFQQGNKEIVACWRVQNGEEVWRHEYDCHAHVSDFPGPRSTPTLDGVRVYTVGSDGTMLCLNAATGSPYWRKDLLSEFQASSPKWGVAFSPLIDGDLVFTSPGGRNGGALAAFHKITGELVWKRLDELAGYSSPIAVTIGGTRQIVFFLGDCLVAVRARDGELCWRYPWETFSEVNAATPLVIRARRRVGAASRAAPGVRLGSPDLQAGAASRAAPGVRLGSPDLQAGAASRAAPGVRLGSPDLQAPLDDDILHYVFIASGYDRGCALLKIVPAKNGGFEAKKVYSGKQMRSHFASPVRRGQYLYGIDDSRLACLDLRTGKVMWTRSGCNKGSLLRVNDFLLVLGEDGKLWLLDASPEKQAPRAEARPFRDGRCWTMPVLADGKLFLRNERQMQCLDLTKPRSRDEERPRGR